MEASGKVASDSLFFSLLLSLTANQRTDEREKDDDKERERKRREHRTHFKFSNYILCHARLQKVEWLLAAVSCSYRQQWFDRRHHRKQNDDHVLRFWSPISWKSPLDLPRRFPIRSVLHRQWSEKERVEMRKMRPVQSMTVMTTVRLILQNSALFSGRLCCQLFHNDRSISSADKIDQSENDIYTSIRCWLLPFRFRYRRRNEHNGQRWWSWNTKWFVERQQETPKSAHSIYRSTAELFGEKLRETEVSQCSRSNGIGDSSQSLRYAGENLVSKSKVQSSKFDGLFLSHQSILC